MQDYLTGETDPLLDPLIKSYYQANLNLARTIGIKSSRSADQQNIALSNQYGTAAVNFDLPTSWKYYLNLSGEYHPTDTQMSITSLDTLQLITFSKEVLAVNPNTLTEYQFGSRYYQTLVKQYPDQEDLIMGILMPCDINTAIGAEDGTILRFDTNLVEFNEYSLIKNLESAIKRHLSRWYVDAYSVTDNYYLMAYYAKLYLFIIMKLFNLRDGKRNTYEAHSFHVRMFLRGYMGLDQFYQFMTQKQAMYLYRNLPRLVKSMGYDSQFQELLTNLLTPRNIQMFGYTVQQTNSIGEDYAPISMIQSEPLNQIQAGTASEIIQPLELFAKEETVLYGTQDYYDANYQAVLNAIKYQDQAKVITKDVITQTQESVSIFSLTQKDIELSLWGYMSAIGLYTANVTYTNPKTGLQNTLSAKNAFVYLYYLSLSYTSQDLVSDLELNIPAADLQQITNVSALTVKHPVTLIPTWLAQTHVSLTSPTLSSLLLVVEQGYQNAVTAAANELLQTLVPLSAINTNDLFYQLCLNTYLNYLDQNTLISSYNDPLTRGYVKNMVYRCYQDTMVQFYPTGTTIASFLLQNNLDSYESVGSTYLAELITNLYAAGTGAVNNSSSDQKNVTQAMIEIMRALTSYNIQYIEIINEVDLTLVRVEPIAINGYVSIGDGTSNDYVTNIADLPVGISVLDVTETYLTQL